MPDTSATLTDLTTAQMLLRLGLAGLIGGLIGYERHIHHKAVGVAGMMLVAIGSAAYMLLASHLAATDPASLSRALQGLLQGIGFLGGAVIFKTGSDVRGIKTAAAIWITGAVGLAIGTWYWGLGIIVGLTTAAILFAADHLSPQRDTGRSENERENRDRERSGNSRDENPPEENRRDENSPEENRRGS